MPNLTDESDTSNNQAGSPKTRLIAFGILVIGIVVLAVLFRDQLSLAGLASYESQFQSQLKQAPVLVYGVAFLAYVVITGLSLPGAAALTLLYGWLFGFLPALVLVSFASTTGATIAFLISRYFLRDFVSSKYGERLSGINLAFEREGAFYLFTLRLVVIVPFFVINTLMGLTPIRTWTFWWVSQLGMLPGTAAYVYAGSTVPDLQTLAEKGASSVLSIQLLIAFAILGFLPLLLKKLVAFIRGNKVMDEQAEIAS